MVFEGKYYYERSEGLEKFLSKIAGPVGYEAAQSFKQDKPILEVFYSDNKYTFVFTSGVKQISNSFELDSDFDEMLFKNFILKSFVSQDGDKFNFVSKIADGNVIYRDYSFSSEGIHVNYSDKKYQLKANSFYKRA